MKIICPAWKNKERNIDILIDYLSGIKLCVIADKYEISLSLIVKVVKIQLRELFSDNGKCKPSLYRRDKDNVILARKYKEFLLNETK